MTARAAKLHAMPPAIERTLDNGVRVQIVPMPHRTRAHLWVQLGAGPVYEDDSSWGLSHLVEHMVFRGAGRLRDVSDVTRAADAFGGDIQALTYRDRMTFDTRLDTDRVADACALLASLLCAPRFASLRVEKHIVLEELAELVDQHGVALDGDTVLFARTWPGTPLARSIEGTPAAVRRYQLRHLRAFHRRLCVGANIVVTLAGDVRARDVFTVERCFGKLPKGPPPPHGTAPRAARARMLSIVDDDAGQTTVRIGFRAPKAYGDGSCAVAMLARVLDDGPVSRLQQRLVDARGLAYGVWCHADPYRHGTLFELGATVTAQRVPKLVRALLDEASQLAGQPPSRKELSRVVERTQRDLRDITDDPALLGEAVGKGVLFGEAFDPNRELAQLRALRPSDVSAAARAVLVPSQGHVVLQGQPSAREAHAVRTAFAALAV